MASEKQIRANRANAKRSSGPKTAAGRFRSSRNALRHGLSLPLDTDPAASMRVRRMAQLLVADGAAPMQTMAAYEMAQAHAQLQRVGAVRSRLMANLDFASPNLKQMRRLAALERYQRQALSRRRRAARTLTAASDRTSDSSGGMR
jgi:hypothetical protein